MLLKPLNEMRFNVLDILSEDNLSFLANMCPISPVLAPTLWHIENHL